MPNTLTSQRKDDSRIFDLLWQRGGIDKFPLFIGGIKAAQCEIFRGIGNHKDTSNNRQTEITQQEVTWESLLPFGSSNELDKRRHQFFSFDSNSFLFNFPLIYIEFSLPISQHACKKVSSFYRRKISIRITQQFSFDRILFSLLLWLNLNGFGWKNDGKIGRLSSRKINDFPQHFTWGFPQSFEGLLTMPTRCT